jgi:hypothetical protein
MKAHFILHVQHGRHGSHVVRELCLQSGDYTFVLPGEDEWYKCPGRDLTRDCIVHIWEDYGEYEYQRGNDPTKSSSHYDYDSMRRFVKAHKDRFAPSVR